MWSEDQFRSNAGSFYLCNFSYEYVYSAKVTYVMEVMQFHFVSYVK